MVKRLKRVVITTTLGISLFVAFATAYAMNVICPIDNFSMMWTGQTQTEWGKMLYQYKCPGGHITWVVQ